MVFSPKTFMRKSSQLASKLMNITGSPVPEGKRFKIEYPPDLVNDRGTIIFPHMRGSEYLLTFECMLASRLTLEGYKVVFLACTGLPICSNMMHSDGEDKSLLCSTCRKFTKDFVRRFGFDVFDVDDFLETAERKRLMDDPALSGPGDIREIRYKGLDLLDLTEVSVSRELCSDALSKINEKNVQTLWKEYIKGAVVLYEAYTRVLDRIKPDIVILPNGGFYWYSVMVKAAEDKRIRYVTYESDFRPGGCGDGGSWYFKNRGKVYEGDFHDVWDDLRDLDLTPAQDEDLTKFLTGKERDSIYHPHPTDDIDSICTLLGLDRQKPIVTFFPNLTWDSTAVGRRTIFPSIFEWLDKSIEHLWGKDVNVVVRVHPAEKMVFEGDRTKDKVEDYLKQDKFEDMRNLYVVGSESDISSYSLIDTSKVVVVYTSTVGLEAVIRGKPVLFCGKSKDIDYGFGYIPKSQQEYYGLLDKADMLVTTTQQVKAARKWAYIYNFILPIPLQLFDVSGQFEVSKYLVSSVSGLKKGKNTYLDPLVDDILNNRPIYNRFLTVK